jgi:anti-sigma factor RsiW
VRAALVCADGVALLMDDLEGVVAPAQHEALQAHVAGCPRCRAFVKSYLATPRILRDATASALPAEVGQRLRQFLRSRLRTPPP